MTILDKIISPMLALKKEVLQNRSERDTEQEELIMRWYQSTSRESLQQREARRHKLCAKQLDVTQTTIDRWIRNHLTHGDRVRVRAFQKHLAGRAVCRWFGDWNRDISVDVKATVDHAEANNALFQIVIYNIPYRDAGGYSAGGALSRKTYMEWIQKLAKAVGTADGIIIVEPDALAHAMEFNENLREERVSMLREVNETLRRHCKNAFIYLDVGHPKWLPADTVVELFLRAGGRFIDGIALNVSNYYSTDDCYEYGMRITSAVSDFHGIMIDTSRNGGEAPGAGDYDNVFNFVKARIGMEPQLRIQGEEGAKYSNRLHGLLWVKVPGESDGATAGAPNAGVFYEDGAWNLVQGTKK